MWPEINIFGFNLPTYFLVLSLVFTFIIYALLIRAKCVDVDPNKALDLYLYILVGSFLGARLFYIFYQAPSYFFKNPMEIFYVWNGGFVFYGGFIGGTFSIFLFTFSRKENLTLWFNFCAPLLSLGYGLGRFACLLNGCCFGEVSDAFWALNIQGAFRHPTQIYASFWELSLFVLLLIYEKARGFNTKPPVFSLWLMGHGTCRLVMESFRADDRGAQISGYSISTVISFVLILLGLVYFIKSYKKVN